MIGLIESMADNLPSDSILHALGIGTPADIKDCFKIGFRFFDCVLPTRNARHGLLYKFSNADKRGYEEVRILSSRYATAKNPIDGTCDCEACRHPAGYIRHLLKIKEPLGYSLASIHNLRFYSRWLEFISGAKR